MCKFKFVTQTDLKAGFVWHVHILQVHTYKIWSICGHSEIHWVLAFVYVGKKAAAGCKHAPLTWLYGTMPICDVLNGVKCGMAMCWLLYRPNLVAFVVGLCGSSSWCAMELICPFDMWFALWHFYYTNLNWNSVKIVYACCQNFCQFCLN